MPNVIIFTDQPPRNLGTTTDPIYLSYLTRAAGAHAVASNLRKHGFSVLVIDHCTTYTFNGVKKIIDDNRDELLWIGLSTTFFSLFGHELETYKSQWESSTELYFDNPLNSFIPADPWAIKPKELIWGTDQINLIARHCQVPFLVGGAWVSTVENGGLQNLENNVRVIPGRAEDVTLEITQLLSQHAGTDNSLAVFKNNNNYDDVDFKHSKFLWTPDDRIEKNEWLPLEISRGCAFNCAYCNYDRKSNFDNYKNPTAIRDELVRNYEHYGVTNYILMDDLYNDSKEKVRILYDQVWSKLPFTPEWTSYMRLDLFWADPESAEIIKASGARMGSFGIETLHNRAGRKVGKGLGKQRIFETLARLKEVWKDDVLIQGFFIAGLPDEPEDHILETIEWTGNTDLLDTVKFAPLWITPPDHKKFVLKTHSITDDNEKYNIKWLDHANWINQAGVTFERAKQLSDLGNSTRVSALGGFGDYPEYRQLGWKHSEIVEFTNNNNDFMSKLTNERHVITKKIISKVKTTLNI
jgi:hypothetical protein